MINHEDSKTRIEGIDLIRKYEGGEKRFELIRALFPLQSDKNAKVSEKSNQTIVSKYQDFKVIMSKNPIEVLKAHA